MAKKSTTSSTVHEFEMELTPFSSYQLYGDKKYSLQNMVLKMVGYPAIFGNPRMYANEYEEDRY